MSRLSLLTIGQQVVTQRRSNVASTAPAASVLGYAALDGAEAPDRAVGSAVDRGDAARAFGGYSTLLATLPEVGRLTWRCDLDGRSSTMLTLPLPGSSLDVSVKPDGRQVFKGRRLNPPASGKRQGTACHPARAGRPTELEASLLPPTGSSCGHRSHSVRSQPWRRVLRPAGRHGRANDRHKRTLTPWPGLPPSSTSGTLVVIELRRKQPPAGARTALSDPPGSDTALTVRSATTLKNAALVLSSLPIAAEAGARPPPCATIAPADGSVCCP
jgi:hypothetical protein